MKPIDFIASLPRGEPKAAKYDQRAIALYGKDAVLNDPDTVDTPELDVRDQILSTTP